MIEDVNQLVDFLVEHEITADQYLFCHILYLDKEESGTPVLQSEGPAIANIYKYGYESFMTWFKRKPFPQPLIQDLINKEFIRDYNKSGKSYPDDYEVTTKFIDAVFTSYGHFEEFWSAYPAWNEDPNTGKKFPLRSVDKDELEKLYGKKCKTLKRHKKIMEAVEYSKKDKTVSNMRIDNFLKSEHWKNVLELKQDSPEVSNTTGLV